MNYIQETVEEHAAKRRAVSCGDLHGDAGTRTRSAVSRKACAQLVKPGGDVFFSTLNRNGKSWLMAVVGAEYAAHGAKGTHPM